MHYVRADDLRPRRREYKHISATHAKNGFMCHSWGRSKHETTYDSLGLSLGRRFKTSKSGRNVSTRLYLTWRTVGPLCVICISFGCILCNNAQSGTPKVKMVVLEKALLAFDVP